jgi:uncharacterized protein (DUF433 family)
VRWWPLGRDHRVVLDPERSFGRPIITPESVPTAILARAFQAEGSIDSVARWYEVDPRSVLDAVEFEKKLAGQQIANLVKWWPAILDQARLVEHGTGFEVPFRTSRLKPVIARR